ncbi:nucleoside triphosphate pyrophosphohydrolase family protein [Psychrobacter sp. UBA2514]|jgi:predicted HAD superfamily Cof-like phosphohydrolase|uniref:nucleoside triphosphate pyrophosphohydrolase family protein n=1 Tax=Psychrobacter sp. UBA2514 TaxID=1947346 RepID=UPI0025807A0F|nr:nucleoside triphosphate pyrophosphohydrolase family protein [Psychrobacter sp. UBA2514]|tara:strand:+ start:18744 stop:19466 length:723 start_codon:yes stop_codon:yes gene_type:complete
MSNLPLKALRWFDYKDGTGADTVTVICEYTIYRYGDELMRDAGEIQSDGDHDSWVVAYYNRHTEAPTKEATGFATIDEAKAWAWNHYNEKMQPYVKPDSITDIANWFKAAKPEPTDRDICTQIGCHYEEVYEMDVALYGNESNDNEMMAQWYKGDSISVVNVMQRMDKIELLDALCDQIVTATGVAYMMGFDIEGALKEVIRSNNSKMVKGKFEYDKDGKIAKPESYSKPDLTPFVKQGE